MLAFQKHIELGSEDASCINGASLGQSQPYLQSSMKLLDVILNPANEIPEVAAVSGASDVFMYLKGCGLEELQAG